MTGTLKFSLILDKIFKPLFNPDKTVYVLRSAPKIKTMIETEFKKEMKELGYL